MSNVTINDIARKCGVSYATISRVLNNRPGVNATTKKKVLEVSKSMGYHPNAMARGLVTKQSKTIALVIPEITNPFYSDIALAVDDEAHKRGYNTVICNTSWDYKLEKERLLLLQDSCMDGIILRPCSDDLLKYKEITLPLVLLTYIDNKQYSCVEVENDIGGYLATNYLISRGYKRIGFIGGVKNTMTTQVRLKGYLNALKENNIKPDNIIIRYGDFTIGTGYKVSGDLLSLFNPPDAFFCNCDLIALGVLQKSHELGINIPLQLGVVGFDDIIFSSLPFSKLTTVKQPREQIGRLATEILIRSINALPERLIQRVILRPELVVRDSTK